MKGQQIVIYGANGWLGRSAISTLVKNHELFHIDDLLLIGSRESRVNIGGVDFEIISQTQSLDLIKKDCIFFNAAFLRRERLHHISLDDFEHLNNAISIFAENIVASGKVMSFINLSSGAAAAMDQKHKNKYSDIYAYLKHYWEERFEKICKGNDARFINCRIFSITGIYLNEFNNLAISSFIGNALKRQTIKVRSPKTLRSYVDAEELCTLLLKLSLSKSDFRIDSGGELVSLKELAEFVGEVIYGEPLELLFGDETSPNYFGNYSEFNSLAKEYDVSLSDIKLQVKKTCLAFRE